MVLHPALLSQQQKLYLLHLSFLEDVTKVNLTRRHQDLYTTPHVNTTSAHWAKKVYRVRLYHCLSLHKSREKGNHLKQRI